MDIRNTPPYLLTLQDKLLLQKAAAELQSQSRPNSSKKTNPYQDIVRLSKNSTSNNEQGANGSKLKSDITEKTPKGFRRTQEFEDKNGKIFTRIEEKTIESDRSKALVILQNGNGDTSVFENIIDQQSDGTFRQIRRFTDNTGHTETNIQYNVLPDKDIIFGQTNNSDLDKIKELPTGRGSAINFTA